MATRANTRAAIPVRSFRAEDLQQLLAVTEGPCVSIHLSTHRRYPEWTQDPTHFKNLLAQTEAQLAARPGAREAAAMLEPARRLLDDPGIWEYALDGLAVYVSPSYAAAFRVPMPLPDAVVVADTFHTKPLFRFLGTNSRYYVLAISQNAVTLYHGSSFGAEPVDLRALPADLSTALGASELDEHERGLAGHGGVGGRILHGRGPGKEERKETLLKFFRAIDKGLHEYLHAERAPLLIAGVKYYRPIYREVNTYPHLLAEGLDGNFERAKGDVIHAAAWPIVGEDRERRVAEWSDRFLSLAPKGLAIEGVEAVASAVVQGRVRAILAAENGNTWGRLDRATGEVTLLRGPNGTASPDLLDDICEEGWKRGAEIYVLPQPSLPTARPIAAVLRF